VSFTSCFNKTALVNGQPKQLTYTINSINLSSAKLVQTVFKNPVRTAKKTPPFTVTKINRLTLFKEIIAVYSENRTEHTNTLCGQNAELLGVKTSVRTAKKTQHFTVRKINRLTAV
jgi:hypothetical protein